MDSPELIRVAKGMEENHHQLTIVRWENGGKEVYSHSNSHSHSKEVEGELEKHTTDSLDRGEVILIGLMVTLILISVIGNCLVCVAIFTDRRLRKLGNAFIVSLAIADLFVSCLVMTFALCNDFMNRWIFGDWFCDVWISFDIMCCTASILNLCAISLDRFIHIKDCLLYNQWMTRKVAISAVIIIWFISALVSFVPINLGWHKPASSRSSFHSTFPSSTSNFTSILMEAAHPHSPNSSLLLVSRVSAVASESSKRKQQQQQQQQPLEFSSNTSKDMRNLRDLRSAWLNSSKNNKSWSSSSHRSADELESTWPAVSFHNQLKLDYGKERANKLNYQDTFLSSSSLASSSSKPIENQSSVEPKVVVVVASTSASASTATSIGASQLTKLKEGKNEPLSSEWILPLGKLTSDNEREEKWPKRSENRYEKQSSSIKETDFLLSSLQDLQEEEENKKKIGSAQEESENQMKEQFNQVKFNPQDGSQFRFSKLREEVSRSKVKRWKRSKENLLVMSSEKLKDEQAGEKNLLPSKDSFISETSKQHQHQQQQPAQCMLILTPTYAVISSSISFCIPCIIMLGLYTKLFACARKHVKNIQAISKAPAPLLPLPLLPHPPHHPPLSTAQTSNQVTFQQQSSSLLSTTMMEEKKSTGKVKTRSSWLKLPNSSSPSHLPQQMQTQTHIHIAVEPLHSEISPLTNAQQASLSINYNNNVTTSGSIPDESKPFLPSTPVSTFVKGTTTTTTTTIAAAAVTGDEEDEDEGRMVNINSHKQISPSSTQFSSLNQQPQPQPQAQSGQMATHKAAVTLGIIMGTFLFCWVPFFCLNIIKAFCVDCIPSSIFRAFTWLGYANSALNPIIYGIHNTEFRNAFNRIFFKHLNIKNSRYYISRRLSYDMRHNNNNIIPKVSSHKPPETQLTVAHKSDTPFT